MTQHPERPPRGPIEDLSWPAKLRAYVFTPGPRPRMHGYDMYGDLAQHYRASDLMLTGLRGSIPSPEHSELFDAAMAFLSPVMAGEAPTHAALLSRSCGAGGPAVTSVGAALLAEHAEAELRAHAPLLRWLDAPGPSLPPAFVCPSEPEREVVGLLARRLERHAITLPILRHDPTRLAASLAALHRCGLVDPDRLLAALVLARLPGLLAEGFAAPRGDRRGYPIDLPKFRYQDEQP